MKKIVPIIIFLILINILFIQGTDARDLVYDSYEGELGIEIRSYSPNWQGEKLRKVYEELLNNTYGEEIHYLSTINLHPNNPHGGEEEGLYHGAYTSRSFLNRTDYSMKKGRTIDLFNMLEKEGIEDIAKILSHEYGHHFTLYYLLKEENRTFEDWQDTNYARIRGLAGDARVRDDYNNGHQWNIIEIAAEDYIQLFGSINAKRPTYYDDILSRTDKHTLDDVIKWDNNIFNVYPQENFNIPLANDVPNLREYWIELSGIEPRVLNKPPQPPVLGLTQVKNLGYNKKQYIFQWIESIDEDSQELLYTMVAFDQTEQQVIPIKTVRQGEELRAVIGSTKIVDGKGIIFYSDTFTDTPKNIRVFAMDEHGNIVSSNILAVDFNNPVVTELHHMEYLQERLAREGLNEVEIHVQQEVGRRGWLDWLMDLLRRILENFLS